jgi:LCP family protein required for cell wall assembly
LGLSAALLLPLPHPASSQSSSKTENSSNSSNQVSAILSQDLVPYKVSRPVNVLVMGIDSIEGAIPGSLESFSSRSDALLLVRVDPIQKSLTVLSIPRDTQVEIPSYGLTKINHANWFGGPLLTKTVIEHNFNDVPIDRYIRINTGAFREIVDLVGGVRVFVPQDMHYVDQTQKLNIDLKEGWQTLNGDQAEQFARFRHDLYGDIGRVQRQQILLKALRQKLLSPQILPKIPQILQVFRNYVDTNLTLEEMAALVGLGVQVDTESVHMVMLPGRASEPGEFAASYWLMDDQARDRLLTEYFNQPALIATSEVNSVTDIPTHQLRIAVQNATGEPEQAEAMANYLENLGFGSVYLVPDWPDELAATQIIVQRGDLQAAQSLHDVLQIGRIEGSSIGDLESDLTLRLGKDSDQLLANPYN